MSDWLFYAQCQIVRKVLLFYGFLLFDHFYLLVGIIDVLNIRKYIPFELFLLLFLAELSKAFLVEVDVLSEQNLGKDQAQ
jgi:hypothetical protein